MMVCINFRKIGQNQFFKHWAGEAAEGCLASVAAKLVKTAIKISFDIHAIAILAIYRFDAIFDTESALPDGSQLFETFV